MPQKATPEGTTQKTIHVLQLSSDITLVEAQRLALRPHSQVLLPAPEPPGEDLFPPEVLAEAEGERNGETVVETDISSLSFSPDEPDQEAVQEKLDEVPPEDDSWLFGPSKSVPGPTQGKTPAGEGIPFYSSKHPVSQAQLLGIQSLLLKAGMDKYGLKIKLAEKGRQVEELGQLTMAEADKVIEWLQGNIAKKTAK